MSMYFLLTEFPEEAFILINGKKLKGNQLDNIYDKIFRENIEAALPGNRGLMEHFKYTSRLM